MLTRDQKYAIAALEHVQRVKASETKEDTTQGSAKSYGVMAHKLPILIHSAGLAQALAFVKARGNNKQKELLNDLALTVGKEGAKTLLHDARTSDIRAYIRLTHQILNALLWYKRYAQSELGVESGDQLDEEEASNG